jgi:hypothetical protein
MNAATSGLIDIIDPASPAASAVHYPLIWLIAAATVLLLAIAGIWWQRGRCHRAARKRLRQLRLSLQTAQPNQHHVAYALAGELVLGLQLKQLQADNPPATLPQTAHADWAYLVTALDRLRYQAETRIDSRDWARLFVIAESVLRRSRPC